MPDSDFDLEPGLIYLNHAAVSPWPRRTAEAVTDFARENACIGSSRYPLWVRTEQALLDSRPSAFFSVSLVARKPAKNTPETNPYVKAFLSHPFSVMRHFCGDVTHVQAFFGKPGYRKTAGDPLLSINSIHVIFENGCVGYLLSQRGDSTFGLGGWWSVEVAGTRGTFCIENCIEKVTYWPAPGTAAETAVARPRTRTAARTNRELVIGPPPRPRPSRRRRAGTATG